MRFQAKALVVWLCALSGACAEEIEGSPTEAAQDFLQARFAGQSEENGWSLGAVVPLVESETETIAQVRLMVGGAEQLTYFSFTRDKKWRVRFDLKALFRRQIFDDPKANHDAGTRCATRVSERWGGKATTVHFGKDSFTIRAGHNNVVFHSRRYVLQPTQTGLMGVISYSMVYPTEPGEPRGEFQDAYVYDDGTWERRGMGRLFDLAPRR